MSSKQICDKCGKTFEAGNRPDGFPNSMGFIQKDKKKITVCADCIIEIGKADEQQRREFFEKLGC